MAIDAVVAVGAVLAGVTLGSLRTLGAVLTILAVDAVSTGADRGGAGFPAHHDHAAGAVGFQRARLAIEAVRAVLTVDTIAAILAVDAVGAGGGGGAGPRVDVDDDGLTVVGPGRALARHDRQRDRDPHDQGCRESRGGVDSTILTVHPNLQWRLLKAQIGLSDLSPQPYISLFCLFQLLKLFGMDPNPCGCGDYHGKVYFTYSVSKLENLKD